MTTILKTHTTDFKTKVAITATKEQKTINELAP